MTTKFIRLIIAVLCVSVCFAVLASCDDLGEEAQGTDPATTIAPNAEAPTTDAPGSEEVTTEAPFAGIEKSEWEAKFSDEVFQNYTVIFEGRMSVTEDGQYDSTSNVWQKLKITSDKIEITARAEEVGSPSNSGEFILVFDGEVAEAQKVQNSQLFLLILRGYDNFVYDAETKTYIIPETVVLEEVVKGIGGDGILFDVPVEIEIREAVVTFTEDGVLSSLTCDYSQTMYMDEVINTSGNTTWTFSDFGTTVIVEE